MTNFARNVHFVICRSSVEYKECKIIALPDKYGYGFAAMTFQKDSPLAALFGYYIDVIRQAGIHDLGPRYDLDILGLDTRFNDFVNCLEHI